MSSEAKNANSGLKLATVAATSFTSVIMPRLAYPAPRWAQVIRANHESFIPDEAVHLLSILVQQSLDVLADKTPSLPGAVDFGHTSSPSCPALPNRPSEAPCWDHRLLHTITRVRAVSIVDPHPETLVLRIADSPMHVAKRHRHRPHRLHGIFGQMIPLGSRYPERPPATGSAGSRALGNAVHSLKNAPFRQSNAYCPT